MNVSPKFNALIVDDEAEARKNLSYYLQSQAGSHVNLVGEADNTRGAELLIRKHQPDVVFLDIDMPRENAFQFLERVGPVNFEVIFITAYDMYAIKAFKLNALDYIVKPIDSSELDNAISKLKEKLAYKQVFRQYSGYTADLMQDISAKRQPRYVTLRDGNTIEVVAFENVIMIEAKGSYSKVHFYKNNLEKTLVMSYSIAEYEELLPANSFFRVHKSFLINCRQVDKVVRADNPYILTKSKQEVPIGRRRYPGFMSFLKTNNINSL